jgi:hypothetical protein
MALLDWVLMASITLLAAVVIRASLERGRGFLGDRTACGWSGTGPQVA